MSVAEPLPTMHRRDDYIDWIEAQGVPIYEGFYIPDLRTVELGDWARKGGRGTVLRLKGAEDKNDSYVCEIPPGGELAPDRHLYEELIYVVDGRGSTRVWNRDGVEAVFEWGPGSVFSIPLNASYQHFNGSGTKPARFFAVTSAPLVMKLFHNMDFIFNCDFDFHDRFGARNSDFSGAGTGYEGRVWEANFIADVHSVELQPWRERGLGNVSVMFEIAQNTMCGHVSQFPVGTYKKAHRHGAGAHVTILSGEGYSLLWREGDPIQKVDWARGSVVVPPGQWFHQHFNTGDTPARYLALRWGSKKFRLFPEAGIDKSTKEGGDQIEYGDEDLYVRETFEAALAAKGIENRMAAAYQES